ncbi:presequence protease, mitochondrial-like [Schistocerca gregaria]|uniref:presequence protease, mitochondrial-like n=1 Tax=Schistocerca gregaria TaxID=7010 RepID=UPI00211F1F23|nr:presequence protease, mitochondrial-like [Schistocerca gregaria]
MESERQQKVAVAWLLHPLEDAYQVFLMSVTCHLMINGPASPMYRALIESGLGTAYSPGSGYDSSPRTASFSIGVSDARDGSAESVESAVFDALAEVAKEGFPPARLESALHQIEYSKKNVTTGFGIELYSSIQHLWMHGVDFCPLLSTANYIARLRRDLDENPRLFQQLVQSYFLDNTHRLTLVVSPDEAYSSRLQLEEAQALAELRKCSSAAGDRETDDPSPSREEAPAKPSLDSTHLPSTQLLDRHRLDMLSLLDRHRLDTRSLLNRQLQHDASMLPKIHFTELDKDPRKPPTILHEQLALPPAGGTSRSIPIQQVYEEPTNGIVYLRCSLDVTHVPSELLMLVPLFSSTLGKMAAGPYDHHQLAELLELVTGEFHVSANVINNHSSLDQYNLRLNIYSSCLKKNLSPMIELWNHVLFAPNFSNLHLLKIILGGITQQLHADLVASGDSYARSLAASSLLPGCYMDEAWTGITQFNYLKSLDDHSSDLLQTSRHLSDISSHVLRASPKIAVNAEHDVYSDIHRHLSNLFQQLPPPVDPLSSSPPPHQALGWRFSPKKRFFELPSQVNYVSQVFKTVPYSHPDFAPLCLLATLLSSNFLHSSIREQGGAYGAHCGHSMGTVQFSSYRDPNVDSTLSAFSQGIQWAHRGDFSNTHLEEAKLQLLASLDSPTPPSRRGIDLFESNISHDMQRTTRHRIFDSTKEDLVRVCSEYLLGHHNASNSSIAVFGCDQTLRSRPDWERAK